MKRNILLVLISMIAVLSVQPARAKECKGVSFPDSLQLDGRALTLNGLGLRQATMLEVNVYVAALYVTKPSADANALLGSSAPKQLVLQFVRNVSAAELNKAWEEGFDKRLAPFKSHLETLKGWMADMKTGQQLTFVHRPGRGLAAQPQAPPSSPLFKSGFGVLAPSQIEKNAFANSSPLIVPLAAPFTSTSSPGPGR